MMMTPTTAMYSAFIAMSICVYWNVEPSRRIANHDWMLTVATGLQVLAFALLTWNTRSRAGEKLSQRTTLCLFLIAHMARFFDAIVLSGIYVPEDNTNKVYLYQLLEFCCLLILVYQLRKMIMFDIGQREKWDTMITIVIDSLFLAFLTMDRSKFFYDNLLWMFGLWVETFALIPEILILLRSKYADKAQLHFVSVSSLSGAMFGWCIALGVMSDHRSLYGLRFAAVFRVVVCVVCFGIFAKMSLDSTIRTCWASGKDASEEKKMSSSDGKEFGMHWPDNNRSLRKVAATL